MNSLGMCMCNLQILKTNKLNIYIAHDNSTFSVNLRLLGRGISEITSSKLKEIRQMKVYKIQCIN